MQQRLAELPPGFRPNCRRLQTAPAVVQALNGEPFGLPVPDALDLVQEYGLSACEGAVVKTLAHLPRGGIRSPRRWLIATIHKGKGWSPEQVEIYMANLLEDTMKRLEGSDLITYRRLAADLRRQWGEVPENIIELQRNQ